jgi:O-antigen ligase
MWQNRRAQISGEPITHEHYEPRLGVPPPTRVRRGGALTTIEKGGRLAKPPLAFAERTIFAVLAAGLLVVPVILGSGLDTFRLPKELAFRAEAIGLVMLAVFWLTSRRRTWTFTRRPEFLLTAVVIGWCLITTATSTNRPLSVDSLITILAAAVIFIATCLAAQTVTLIAVDVLMIACCANAVLVTLQELKIWSPFPSSPDTATHYGSVALLGNANDVGTYLVVPAIAAIVLAVTASGLRRWIYAGVGIVLVGGIAASGTRTALGALLAALIVFALSHSRRAAMAVGVVIVLLTIVILSPSTSMGQGVRELAEAVSHRDYQHLFSERLPPFLSAADMARDHPLVGVGPGNFKYHYMAYRVGLRGRYPDPWLQGFAMNWGEVHNDHLQVASETGLPGYALFLLAIGIGGGIVGSRRRKSAGASSPEGTFARAFRWPLATAVFVICLGQFPLEIAAPRLMILTLAALCVTWSNDDRSPRSAGTHPARLAQSPVAALLLGAAALVAAGFAINQLCIAPYRGNLILREVAARSLLAQSLDDRRATEIAHTNLHDLDQAASGRRLDPAWYLLYGTNCEILGRWTEAAATYTNALRIDDRPEIYVNRGLVRLHLGQTDLAVSDLASAVRFDPTVIYQLDGELRARVAAAAGSR